MTRPKLIIQIKNCTQCPVYSISWDYEINDGYSDTYSIKYCNGVCMEDSNWFGSEKCILINPLDPYLVHGIAKIIYKKEVKNEAINTH